ncbi:MAG: leucine-rich repeat domain-containing protein [Oscillospiraceae bacterium]|nr:leucine-rich repeat domain-containing protein [Oscillospiraceae bacterium]
MKKMRQETKKNILRVFMLILVVVMFLGIIIMPFAGSASAEEGDVVVTSFETGKLAEAIEEAKDGVDLNNIKKIAVSGGVLNEADYGAICGYPNTEYIELAGCETEGGIIPENAMVSRNQLMYISLPKNTVTIGARAFSGNRNLLKISMPAGVRNIGDYAFEGCEKVEEFTVPAELETLGTGAFSDCKALKSFALPEAIKEIPDNCFAKCSLTELHLGPQVRSIGNGAFSDCHSLTDIYFYGDEPFSASEGTFQNLKVTIHMYSDKEGFEGLENNFVTVAYDMSEESEYVPPRSENPVNADSNAAANEDEEAAEVNEEENVSEAADDKEETSGKAVDEEKPANDKEENVPASVNATAASGGGFNTASVIIIAVLCVVVGVLATLLAVGKKRR